MEYWNLKVLWIILTIFEGYGGENLSKVQELTKFRAQPINLNSKFFERPLVKNPYKEDLGRMGSCRDIYIFIYIYLYI